MPSLRAKTPDGVDIAVHDLGGQGPPALLVHATGFHGRVFGPLARGLWSRLGCSGIDLRGHGESGVPSDLDFDWAGFATDVLTAVDALGLNRPVGIGHSCGGAALLLAEEARPGTFSRLYCFEPIVFPPERPPTPDPGVALAVGARQRREIFASREEAHANYASKAPMNTFDPEVLEAYVRFGFEDLPDGTVRLRCRGEYEALIYENAPRHDAYAHLGEITCPVLVAWGSEGYSFRPEIMKLVSERLENGRSEELSGLGHFAPLEQPGSVAESIIRALDPPPA